MANYFFLNSRFMKSDARINELGIPPLRGFVFPISLACILSVFFFIGIQPKAAVIPAIIILLLSKTATVQIRLSRYSFLGCIHVLPLLIATFPAVVALVQIAFLETGGQGVDFGIFTQLINQVATRNRFWSSLIATEWHNFLTHHFSPYLVVPGLIGKLGLPAPYILIATHVIAVIALILGIQSLYDHYSDGSSPKSLPSPTIAHLFTLSTLLLPAARIGLMWETHDEVLALPFLIWSINAHLAGKNGRKLLLLIPSILFKETLALNVMALCCWYAIDTRENRPAAIALGLASLTFFALYTTIFPGWLWVATFKASERIGSFDYLTSWPVLFEKGFWIAKSFLPAAPFLLLHSRISLRITARICLCAAPNILAILLSKTPNMHQAFNYYSITPVIMVFIGCTAPILRARSLALPLSVSLILCSLIGGRFRTTNPIREMLAAPSALDELHTIVPPSAAVIADDYTISILSAHPHALRIFHANRSNPNSSYIVQKKPPIDILSKNLQSQYNPCGETPRYLVRCRRP